jgi:hypothetical protein
MRVAIELTEVRIMFSRTLFFIVTCAILTAGCGGGYYDRHYDGRYHHDREYRR